MSNGIDEKGFERDLESDPGAREESSRRIGLITTLALVSILGIVIWFIMSQDEAT